MKDYKQENDEAIAKFSKSSIARAETFIDWFIRSEYVEQLTSDRDSDFINKPERAARVHDAAEFGCDGKTHAEVINDWRDAFGYWLSEEHPNYWQTSERFETLVMLLFTRTELWHEHNGSLFKEIG